MKTLKRLFTVIFILALTVFASNFLFAATADSTTTGNGPIYWLDLSWKVLSIIGLGLIEVIVRFFSKYRGILGTIIKVLTWIEDHTNPNTEKIAG